MRLFDKGGNSPLSDINPFLYASKQPDFDLRLVKQNKHWRRYQVSFPVIATGYFPGGKIARGEYYEPVTKEKAPLAILIHGWGDHSVIPFKLMVDGLVRRGTACFVLYLPFHNARLSKELVFKLSHLTPDEWFAGYQIAVTDVRQIIDWAGQNGNTDMSLITVIGLSLGAFVGSMTMGVDTRIKAGVFVVHGGNTGKIMQTNSVARFGRRYRTTEAEYQQNQDKYAEYLHAVAENGFENVTPAQRTYLIDPLTYAPILKGRPVIMFNARWDEIIPRQASLEFQHACGDCEMITFPASHASIWVWYPLIVSRINRFLANMTQDRDFS
jgi:predicted esterase